MNERIKKLVKQAGLTFVNSITDDNEDIECVADTNGGLPCSTELEKFAELIIRECAKVIINGGYWSGGPVGPKRQCTPPEIAEMVKDVFGVKE